MWECVKNFSSPLMEPLSGKRICEWWLSCRSALLVAWGLAFISKDIGVWRIGLIEWMVAGLNRDLMFLEFLPILIAVWL